MTCNDTSGVEPPPELARSFLIVPLSSERFIAKAHLRGADGITLDLEDGVAPPRRRPPHATDWRRPSNK